MAINLATKYEGKLAKRFTRTSVTADKASTEYNWNGVNSINVLSIVTQPLNDYDATASGNRYGTPAELQDTKQTMAITQDKSFAIVIDKKNYDDQMFAKKTGEVCREQVDEQVVPLIDKYNLKTWADNAGTTMTVSAPTKDTIVDIFVDARSAFVNANINMALPNNYAYVPTSNFAKLLRNPDYIKIEKLGEQALANGVVGRCEAFQVVEVPDEYLPTGVQVLFQHKNSVIAPTKLNELKVHTNAPGISGALLEGRYRYDSFVLDTKKKGVLVAKTA